MQTFREYFDARWDFPLGSKIDDYHRALGETFIEYVDEVLAPIAEREAHPLYIDPDQNAGIPCGTE